MDMLRWLLMTVAVLWGLLLPEFYDWSGEDQSRPAPIVRWIALGLLLFDMLAIGWLMWLHFKRPIPQVDMIQWGRFGIWHVLVATAVVAIVVTVERNFKLPLAGGVVVIVVGYAIWLAAKQRAVRWQIVALLICMWAPFLWVFRWPEFRGNMPQVLIMMPGAPELLPAIWTSQQMGWNRMGQMTLLGLFTVVEVLLGLWCIRLGARPALAYSLLVWTASLINSFAFQALVRM